MGFTVVESSSLVSVLFRKLFSYPYISFFPIFYIRECSSTLYVGLARTAPPTNTNLRLTFLLTRFHNAHYEEHQI